MFRRIVCIVSVAAACSFASAQYAAKFEADTFNGSAQGVKMTDQDGYYLPQGTNSIDYKVYTYDGNVLGIVDNPGGGGEQFVAGVGPGSPTFARAQRDIKWGTGVWKVSYDVAMDFPGGSGANNIGSFSVQPFPGSANYIHLFSWVDVNDPTSANAFYLAYNAGGTLDRQPGREPGPEWADLKLNNWYRSTTTIDFDSNRIIAMTIEDLHTGKKGTAEFTDMYLEGGEQGGAGEPTGFRFFAGGGVPNNTVAWDNLVIALAVGCEPCDANCDGSVDLVDVESFIKLLLGGKQCAPDCSGDTNGDGSVDLTDVEGFIECLLG